MKYYRHDKATGDYSEITYDQALRIVLGTYKDCDITRDMLTIVNRIDCAYSWIETKGDNGLVLMAGLTNFTPAGNRYDDEGNRINA